MAASRMCHGVTKSGSPTPSEITSCPFIFATSSKKSRMPLLGSVHTCPATHRFRSVLMVRNARASGRDVESLGWRLAAIEQISLLFVATQHEMRGRRQDAFDRREFLGNE